MVGIRDFETLFNHYLKTAEMIVNYFDDNKETRNNMLAELEEAIKKSCIHDEKSKNVMKTVKEISTDFDNLNDTDIILEVFKEKKNVMLEFEPNVSNHSYLKEYKSQVKAIVDNADGTKIAIDDDIEMTQDEVNTIDPFTKRRMTDPVKNRLCGHVYDRDSVTSILKLNKNTRCPVIGCINKDPINMENIVADIVLRKYLHQNPA